MLYKEFLLRLAELVEESEDHSFYLCHFCDEIDYRLKAGGGGSAVGEAIAARRMLREHPQWVGHIADHAAYLKSASIRYRPGRAHLATM